MWPMPRAIGEALVRTVAGRGVVVVAAAPVRVGADGAHLHVAQRDLLGGRLRADRDHDRARRRARAGRPPTRARACRPSTRRPPRTTGRCRARRPARPRPRPGRGSWCAGSRDPVRAGRCRASSTTARSCPGSRRARWGTPRRTGRCRSAHPGPMVPSHQPTSPCPGPAGPAAWLSPVSACSTSTAFDASGASVPHVSYATVTSVERDRPPRASNGRRRTVTNCRRPGSSPGRHAPVTGSGAVGHRRRHARPWRRGTRRRGRRGCRRCDSMPTDSRTRSGVTPVVTCSSASSCWWVVVAGWMARLRTSPTLARWLCSSSASTNFWPASRPPSMPNDEDRALARGQVLLRALVPRARREARVDHPARPRRAPRATARRPARSAQCRSMRRLSVSRPWRNRNELNGEIAGPMSRWYWSRAFRMYCAGRSASGSCENTRPW